MLGRSAACLAAPASRTHYLFGLHSRFGMLHFVYPAFAPGIPPISADISFPIPGRLFWVYLTGIALLAFVACIAINKGARQAALLLGWTIVLFDLLTWASVFTVSQKRMPQAINCDPDRLSTTLFLGRIGLPGR
jgi:hypothetical protein